MGLQFKPTIGRLKILTLRTLVSHLPMRDRLCCLAVHTAGRSGHVSIWTHIWVTWVITVTVTVTVDIIFTISSKCRWGVHRNLTPLPLLQWGVVTLQEARPPKAMAVACAGAGARGRRVKQKQDQEGP